jgi:DNA-binding CsgD family transcriptional regulator
VPSLRPNETILGATTHGALAFVLTTERLLVGWRPSETGDAKQGTLAGAHRKVKQRSDALTERERECITMAAFTKEQIASALGVSVHVVKFHIDNAGRKLGARSRAGLVIAALRAGSVKLEDLRIPT